VSTGGDNANPGTREEPLASLDGARIAVRKLLPSGTGEDIKVYFMGGTYWLDKTVVFTPNDSPENAKVIYSAIPGEKVIFSSGVPVNNWQRVPQNEEPDGLSIQASGKLWATEIPRGLGCIKTLYRGERKLPRARGKGFSPTEVSSWYKDAKPIEKSDFNLMCFPEGKMHSWINTEDIEIKIIPRYQWTMNVLPLLKVDEENLTAITGIDGTYALIHPYFSDPTQQASVWVENAPEGLDEPGEWIVNTQRGRIYYWPEDQYEPKGIVAPALREYICFGGNEKAGLYTKNIVLRGFTFTHGERDIWDEKTACVQHDWAAYDRDDALVRFRFAERCEIEYCAFTNSGGMGVRCDLYAQNIIIGNNIFSDLGAGAVMLAGYGPGNIDVNKHNRITGNHIHNIGQEYWQSHGILIYQSGDNLVANNFIHDVPYSAISVVGHRSTYFRPGRRSREVAAIRFKETGDIDTWPDIIQFLHGRNNKIEYNRITRTGQVLGDVNAIYISSTGRNNMVRYNYLYDIQFRLGSAAVRSDDEQHDTYLNHNVIHGCTGRGITMKGRNYCENNFIIDIPDPDDTRNPNKIPVEGYLVLKRGPMEGSTIKNNILYHAGTEPHFAWVGPAFNTVTKLSDADTDHNLVYCTGDNVKADEYLSWAWNEQDSEKNSVAADPLFRDLENHDYTLMPGSPAFMLDIKQIDVSKTGLTGPVGPEGLNEKNDQ
jgi:hypothetical protein